MSKEKAFNLSKNFINSLTQIKGKEDYRKIDSQLEKMSAETMVDLSRISK